MSGAEGNTGKLLKSGVSRRRVLQIAGCCGMAMETQRGVAQGAASSKVVSYEVVVYGATPAGVMAAVAAGRVGSHVLLLEPGDFVGGMLVNGTPAAGLMPAEKWDLVGGLTTEFDARVAANLTDGMMAGTVFLELLASAGVAVRLKAGFATVAKDRGRIRSITLDDGEVIGGSIFIDASYEGDLMAVAGVPFAVGREPAMKYGESLGGVRLEERPVGVNPFDAQGLLPGVSAGDPGAADAGDSKIASHQVRVWLTADRRRQAPVEEPEGYQPRNFELLGRCLAVGAAGSLAEMLGWQTLPGNRLAVAESRHAVVSLALAGAQFGYPLGSRDSRERIYRSHLQHARGLLWFLRTDRRVPEPMRKAIAGYGLCADLWPGNRHWPLAMEIREARRMIGELVITQRDLSSRREKTDSIGIGLGALDCPIVDRFANGKDSFVNEGRFWRTTKPFEIPWLAITPRGIHCENLLAPVCLSASHVAWHGLRSEQTLMALGESAGIAAALAADRGNAVQELDPLILQAKLRRARVVLDLPKAMR